jgi:hypothetical protein
MLARFKKGFVCSVRRMTSLSCSSGAWLATVALAAVLVPACGSDSSASQPGGPDTSPEAGQTADAGQPHDAGQPSDAGQPDSGDGSVGDSVKGKWRDGFGVWGVGGSHGGGSADALVRGADGRIYVGGTFTDAAGVPALNVAAWNGSTWAALAAGLPGWVSALAFGPDGALYAGGSFATQSDPKNHLARWDGTAWTTVPGEIHGRVRALATQGARLLVAAESGDIAGLGTSGIAAYSPTTGWSKIGGSGITGDYSRVNSIVVTGSKSFCIAGGFSQIDSVQAANVACWDGTAWAQLGDGLPGEASRLARGPDGTFYAGGTLGFLDAAGNPLGTGIAALNGGSWALFHGGVVDGQITEVRAIAFAPDGALLLGGTFDAADIKAGIPAPNLVRYDFHGGGWSEVAGGVRNDVGVSGSPGVNDLLVLDDGTIWVGGNYSSVKGGAVEAVNIATVKGDTWRPLVPAGAHLDGVAGGLADIAVDTQGRVVAGGGFLNAGGVDMRNVGRLGKNGWEALGAGVDGWVYAVLVERTGAIVVGGAFGHAGNVAALNVARWDGSAWAPIGAGFDGKVYALAEDAQGTLYAVGHFSKSAGVAVNGVARWDGSAWTPLGPGLDGDVTSLAFDPSGHPIVTGSFKNSGSTVLNGLATWDGTSWKPFGSGFGESGYGLRVVATADGFVVGGSFDEVDGHALPSLARWNGKAWSGFGSGLTGPQGVTVTVSDIAVYGKGLLAAGTFDSAGGTAASHVAYWDGASWHPLGAGLDDLPNRLVLAGNSLWVGGPFVDAGGKVSTGIAAWDFGP